MSATYDLRDRLVSLLQPTPWLFESASESQGQVPFSEIELVSKLDSLSEAACCRLIPLFDFDYARNILGISNLTRSQIFYNYLNSIELKETSPHFLIDISYMRSMRPDLIRSETLLLDALRSVRLNLQDPSPLFSIEHFRSALISAGVEVNKDECLLIKFIYLTNTSISPSPYFDLKYLQRSKTDLSGCYNALRFFITSGDKNDYCATPRFDPIRYRRENSQVDFTHYGPLIEFLKFGLFEGRTAFEVGHHLDINRTDKRSPVFTIDKETWIEGQRRFQNAVRSSKLSTPSFQAAPPSWIKSLTYHDRSVELLRFDLESFPEIDIIISCYNQFEKTVECLESIIHSKISYRFRVILVDDASTDTRMLTLAKIPGITYVRNRDNMHFLRSNNLAFSRSNAPMVLLLNNDTQVEPQAIEDLANSLKSNTIFGAVGPKFIFPTGIHQESGCSINIYGESSMYGFYQKEEVLSNSYDRDVDYISGACLMLRREALGDMLFDHLFAPAYYEDADLCFRIRSNGYRVRFVAHATVAHHFSATTASLNNLSKTISSRRNQQTFASKWRKELVERSKIRVLCFYLPQFHPIAENDQWWGKGFTEWRNVVNAQPSYNGHYQPHLPADLGYYDLRLTEIMHEQSVLSSRYADMGFVVYYYNFNGKRILSEPIDRLLKSEVPFPFCFCWANENWTKHWDGGEREALLTQSYTETEIVSLCQDFIHASRDERYIRIDNRPLIIVYRPLLIGTDAWFADTIRKVFLSTVGEDPYLAYVESMESIGSSLNPHQIGFDAAIEFPPQGIGVKLGEELKVRKEDWNGSVYHYAESATKACVQPARDYLTFPTVFPSWDNTARQPLKATSFHAATPDIFGAYVREKIQVVRDTLVGDEKILFVNAWNEWAEGAHLEPDTTFGHMWLEALRDGLESS